MKISHVFNSQDKHNASYFKNVMDCPAIHLQISSLFLTFARIVNGKASFQEEIINFAVMENHLTTDPNQAGMTIDQLSQQIVRVQDVMQAQASHAVNLSLTARNWLIGRHIVEYEQHGQDRAQYGDALLKTLAKRINRRGLGERRLYEFRQMY